MSQVVCKMPNSIHHDDNLIVQRQQLGELFLLAFRTHLWIVNVYYTEWLATIMQVQRGRNRLSAEKLFQVYVRSSSAGATGVGVQRPTAWRPRQCTENSRRWDSGAPGFASACQSVHRHPTTGVWDASRGDRASVFAAHLMDILE